MKIDIVVPWVNPSDSEWVKSFNEYRKMESGEKDDVRFRDMGTMKYWFRSIEQNSGWFNKIFLILASESQVPEWLDTTNPKLRIVYHREFIPESELPTFNSSVINCYIPFIKELSETYVLYNDDFFVFDKVAESDFFVDGIPSNFHTKRTIYPTGDSSWYSNIKNNFLLMEGLTKSKEHGYPDHGPISMLKSVQLFLWKKLGGEFKNALNGSRFRKPKNVTDWIFFDAQYQLGKMKKLDKSIVQYINKPEYSISRKIVCFNDNENLSTDAKYNAFKKAVTKSLNDALPKKSSFEK